MEKSLLTVKEAGELLSIGRTKLYELMDSGALPVVRIGRCVRIPRAGLERWVAQEIERAEAAPR